MSGILITWLVTTISFLIISRLPIGVEIDGFGKALLSAAVFGIINALFRPILIIFTFPAIILTFGLFLWILNAIIFALAAWLVAGFRLRWGFWSALLGSLALGIINAILFGILRAVNL